jgi:uncharacterized protein GlcG (DUF336 family)
MPRIVGLHRLPPFTNARDPLGRDCVSHKMHLVGGGVPILSNGVLVGAVGVARLAQCEDEAAGRAGVAAWERLRAGGW